MVDLKKVFSAVLLLTVVAPTSLLQAENRLARAAFKTESVSESPKSRFAPVALAGGSVLTLVSPEEWRPLAQKLLGVLEETHQYYSSLLGPIPSHTTTLRLVDSEQFYRETGAPRWTNAMYYRGEISIPLSVGEKVDVENLRRSIKHEYTHAVINSMSAARCPGWLDEGLAQWSEGSVNPALEPALRNWIMKRTAVPLSMLQGGFTRLEPAMVPPAYGQSLFAAQAMLNSFGLPKISEYFRQLRVGSDRSQAFEEAFGISEKGFEKALGESLRRWAKHPDEHFLQ